MSVLLGIAAVAVAALTWWFATGAVLWLGRAASEWHGTALLALGVPATLALMLIVAVRDEVTVATAMAGFVSAILVWAWHEAAFLFGRMLGPRREPCPEGVGRRRRFGLAFAALRDHELALAGTLALLVLLSWGAPNTVAVETFGLLWLCRLAAKLCIFEGVPAMAHGLMPARLVHLKSYFGTGRPGLAFALAMAGMSGAFIWLVAQALDATGVAAMVGSVLLATLLGLAILEHALMVLPVRDERLWRWAVPHSDRAEEGSCAFLSAHGNARRLQGVALEARAVVPSRRAT